MNPKIEKSKIMCKTFTDKAIDLVQGNEKLIEFVAEIWVRIPLSAFTSILFSRSLVNASIFCVGSGDLRVLKRSWTTGKRFAQSRALFSGDLYADSCGERGVLFPLGLAMLKRYNKIKSL